MKPPSPVIVGCITSEPFSENTYILQLEGRTDCLVVDPGFEPESILADLAEARLTPKAILNTHGHLDHIAGNAALKEAWPNCPVVIGAGDAAMLTDPALNLSAKYGLAVLSPPADALLRDGQTYSAAGFDLLVREIPGHSPGHVVFLWQAALPGIVIGGDVLFEGSVGRTDTAGEFELLKRGIHEKLFTLPEETIVLPGHGEPTTIGAEKRYNPFVGMRTR